MQRLCVSACSSSIPSVRQTLQAAQMHNNKLWYIHTLECDSAAQSGKPLMDTKLWIHIRNALLSGSSQTEKATHVWDSTQSTLKER